VIWAARRILAACLACALAAALVGAVAAQLQAPSPLPREEKPEDFPNARGREEAFYICTVCHDFGRVARWRMNRERWEVTLDSMVTDHGMPNLEAERRGLLLDYLERAFPEKPAAPRERSNPFLKN
jgi:hypothetical protein